MCSGPTYDAAVTTIEQLRAEFEQAGADLAAYTATLPPRACAEPEPYVNGRGEQVDAHRGWTPEERAEVKRLRDVELDLALQLSRRRAAG